MASAISRAILGMKESESIICSESQARNFLRASKNVTSSLTFITGLPVLGSDESGWILARLYLRSRLFRQSSESRRPAARNRVAPIQWESVALPGRGREQNLRCGERGATWQGIPPSPSAAHSDKHNKDSGGLSFPNRNTP